MQVIDKIISNFTNNKSLYIGEKVTMSEHMIQAAMLAEKAKSKESILIMSNSSIQSLFLKFIELNKNKNKKHIIQLSDILKIIKESLKMIKEKIEQELV